MTSAEAINYFQAGTKLYVLYGGPAYVTKIEFVTDRLVRIRLSNGNREMGLHSSANLLAKLSKKSPKRNMRSLVRALTP